MPQWYVAGLAWIDVFPVPPVEFLGDCRLESGCGLDRELECR
jgi:hypothetical protein